MPYEVLARKWRPQLFQDVVGQEHATQTLMNAIKSGRLAQAYLFSGARGVGKTSVARILAKAMNCRDGEPGIPCNKCRSCLEITDGSSVDVQEIDGASNRGIDEIRELRENIRYMPSSSPYRIYIIDEVHMLTLQAFNALLKTLEEPPPHVKFIFATTEPHKVPVTILSRCQRFDFKRIPMVRIVEHLRKVTDAEGISVNAEALTVIARAACGSMRDAQSLLDQVVAFTGDRVDDSQVLEILGVIDRGLIRETARAVIEGDARACLETVDRAYSSGSDIKEFYRVLTEHFRNLMVSLIAADAYLLDMSASEQEETLAQAQEAGETKIQMILNFLIQREETLRYASSPRLVLETLLIKLCHLGDYLSFEKILRKVEGLEARLIEKGSQPKGNLLAERPSKASPRLPEKVQGSTAAEGRFDQEESWSKFLKFLAGKNRPMFSILKEWGCHAIDDRMVELIKSNQAFSAAYLDDAERQQQFAGYVEDFFGRPLKIKILDPPKPGLEPAVESTRAESGGHEHYAAVSQPVQDILNLFDGRIEEASARPAGEGSAEEEGHR